jgi:prolipoprotein diacylglyceryltransferase
VAGGIPARYLNAATFQPTFLYELIFDVAWAGVLIWLGHHRKIKPPGLFALYVFGYSAYRIFEESLRVDSSVYIGGLRLNVYIASVLTVIGAIWFYRTQRRAARTYAAQPASATEPPLSPEPPIPPEPADSADAASPTRSGVAAEAGADEPAGG